MMSIYAVIRRRRTTRKGKGFSRSELKEAGLNITCALKARIPIDTRRSTQYEENVTTLRAHVEKMILESPVKEEKLKIIELTEVKGIGSKTAEKLIKVGIKNANELATSNAERVGEAIGTSKERASNLIKSARSLLKAN